VARDGDIASLSWHGGAGVVTGPSAEYAWRPSLQDDLIEVDGRDDDATQGLAQGWPWLAGNGNRARIIPDMQWSWQRVVDHLSEDFLAVALDEVSAKEKVGGELEDEDASGHHG